MDRFIGLGTTTPEGPLEVMDQGSINPENPDVANIVITTISSQEMPCQQGCLGCPPVPACHPDDALVLRTKNFDFNGAFTGYSTRFIMNRVGSVGINKAPLTNSGVTIADRSIDILRRSGNYNTTSLKPYGINFRDVNGVTNHTFSTDKANVLTITPGVDGVSKPELDVVGDLKITNRVIVGDLPSLPGDYRMYVQYGILTEHVRIAIKSSQDWSDFVFDKDYQLLCSRSTARWH